MFNENENVDCRKECRDCVYYFEDTDFCLNHMYNVKRDGVNCSDKKSKSEYPASSSIFDGDLEFSEELTDFRSRFTTIADLFEELKALNDELLDEEVFECLW